MTGRGFVVGLMLAGLAACVPAAAGMHESRFGYELAYPEGWEAVDTATLGAKSPSGADRELAGKLAEKVDLALMGPPSGGFTPNVIVVVAADRLEVGPETVSEQTEGLTTTLEAAGGDYAVHEAAYTDIGAHKGIRVEGELRFGEGRPPVRNLIAILPGYQYTYTITCTASPASFNALVPQFEEILAGFSIEPAGQDAAEPPPFVWLLLVLGVAVLLIATWIRTQRLGRTSASKPRERGE